MVTEAETHPERKDKIQEKDAGVRGRAASSPRVKRMASIPEEPIEMLPRPRVEVEVQEIVIESEFELEPKDDPPCMDGCELQVQEHSEHVLEYVNKIREAIMLQGLRVQREEETWKEIVECEVTKPDVHEKTEKTQTKKKRESVFAAVSVKTKDALAGLKAGRRSIFGAVESKTRHVFSGLKVSGENVPLEMSSSRPRSSKIKSVGKKISRALSARRGGGIISTRDSTSRTEAEMEKTRTDDVVIITPPSQASGSEKDCEKTTDHIEFESEIENDSSSDTSTDDGDEDTALLPQLAEHSSSVLALSTSRSKQTRKRRYRSPTPYGYRKSIDGHRRRHVPVRMSTTRIRKGFGVARGVVGDAKMAAKNVLSLRRKIGGWSRL